MLTDIKKSKRRRYIRYAIELDALLTIGKHETVQCTILDFCTGGFFLAFKQADAKVPLNQTIQLLFTIGQESASENFEMAVRAIHITPPGVGVMTDSMPVAIFNALTKIATVDPRATHHERRNSAPNKAKQEHYKRSFKQLLLEKLPPLFSRFLDSLGDELEKINEHSDYFTNRSMLDDVVTNLQFNRETLISEFCSSIIGQIDYISNIKYKKENTITNNNPLALIDKDDFEDWLNMSALVRKLNNHFAEQINPLTKELSRVFGLSKIAINNPVAPAVLCDSFRDVILQFELGNQVKKALYISFETFLINDLTDLYQQSLALLEKHESADKVAHYPPHQTHKKNHPTRPQSLTIPDFEKVTPIPGDREESFSEQHSFPTEDRRLKNLPSINKTTGKLIRILNELNTGAENNPTTPDGVADSTSCFDSEAIINAILQIQHTVADNQSRHLPPEEFNKHLKDTLQSLGQGSKSLSKKDIQYLEIYGKFFETLFNDLILSPAIKPYLEKIHLPLLSLPLQGNDFLDADSHPARNILNQLATLEPAVKSNKIIRNINIKSKIDDLIERIARESITNPAVFTEVEQELDELSKQVTKSSDLIIKRITEAHEGQQKLEIAKRSIQNEIHQRIVGRRIPTIIPLLLDSGWQQLLVVAELNKEKHPDEKLKYFSVIDDLMFWLYEQDSILKIQAGSIHKTLDFIDENLKPVCTNAARRHSIIEELNALLLGVGSPKIRKRFDTVQIEPAPPAHRQIDDNWTFQVEQLQVGDWLMITSGSTGFEPMKLVWIGDIVQTYVFVNRDGLNKLELDKNELAELFHSGAVYKMESLDAPLMERAANSMLQNMNEQLIHNATHDPLTDLLTRDEFVKQLKTEMTKLGESHHILCHMELLDYRVITNICGVDGGKQLLQRLTQLTADRLRNYDLFARLGDKSFAILFKHCSADEGYEKSKKLIKLITDSHFHWQEKSFAIAVSMGLVPFGDNSFDVHQLMKQADSASISAERSSQNRILMFSNEDENLQRQSKLHEWMGHIDDVFAQNRLFARCQMIAPIGHKQHSHQHYEILLGIRDEAGGVIPPDHFIPAVERCKRMPEIDQWVINNVFGWIETNKTDFDKMDGFSINLSGQSINSESFLEFLKTTLESSNIPTEKLTFEITETVASESFIFTKRFISTIKQFGCKFSLDDFGSGYSSYSYLKNLNVDYLKIDGAFVKDIAHNKADIAIVKSMNEIAHSLGLKTIAEYVENNEIRVILEEIGVDYGQGYEIHKPMPLTELVIASPSSATYLFEDDSFWDL